MGRCVRQHGKVRPFVIPAEAGIQQGHRTLFIHQYRCPPWPPIPPGKQPKPPTRHSREGGNPLILDTLLDSRLKHAGMTGLGVSCWNKRHHVKVREAPWNGVRGTMGSCARHHGELCEAPWEGALDSMGRCVHLSFPRRRESSKGIEPFSSINTGAPHGRRYPQGRNPNTTPVIPAEAGIQ